MRHFEGLVSATFSVDNERRTMRGLVVPWDEVSNHDNGEKWKFAKSSARFVAAKFVRFFDEHRPPTRALLGRAVQAEDTDEGLFMTFSVNSGARGDRMLAEAASGRKVGLSVEVEADNEDIAHDPADPSVGVFNLANVTGVALVRNPAFTSSRLISVMASREGGTSMECPTCGQVHAEGVTCTASPPNVQTQAFSRDEVRQLLTEAMQAVVERPGVVDPSRSPGAVTVNEPAPYRFDRRGNIHRGSHDFGVDFIRAVNPAFADQAAHDRVLDFVTAEFMRMDFDVATTDVNELNMPPNRPNMYVDQRSFRYPVWTAIAKGTLTDITPFTFPKFNSASSLVAAHTEGNEPSSGAFTVTNATVTPTAISGKAKITRETWDQGGTPQIGNLIWRQMVKGWFEALEAAAVAVLDAASPTQIDLSGTPGLADEDLDDALTQAFAALQFVRGGFSMDNGFAQVDLYQKLVGAKDSTGRRLYPALGPTNALGTVGRRFGSIDVNGVLFHPAWALAATGSVAASSYLFDSEAVHGWASAPQRLTFDNHEVAHVYIGIWGYKATVISDIAGVREIVYDPS